MRLSVRAWSIASGVLLAVVSGYFLTPLVRALLASGRQPCINLDARLCGDLGEANCRFWSNELGRPGSPSLSPPSHVSPKEVPFRWLVKVLLGWSDRPDDFLCYQLSDEWSYPQILSSVRAQLAARRGKP